MSELLISGASSDGVIVSFEPESVGFEYVGFEVLALDRGGTAERVCGERELCVVVISGVLHVASEHGEWLDLGGRADPWADLPDAAYLPPHSHVGLRAGEDGAEVALCWAPAPNGGGDPRILPGAAIEVETRGHGRFERFIRPILMEGEGAESLLVVEVLTPAGNWSSYPPHKHDHDDPPRQSRLEETYYHRIRPERGFGLMRVYAHDTALDEALTFRDRDCVLVPRGYHTVSAPPGYEVYYLNVMAGPSRLWAVVNDPDHEWMLDGSNDNPPS
ncbi:MAG TPA: 5-deoxy-glucuronate isomerase [Solirubrobacteraceae bacterium]|nr:5-deoxy-glucuronate isomerase [Solirubrobacteraceae bacterium]